MAEEERPPDWPATRVLQSVEDYAGFGLHLKNRAHLSRYDLHPNIPKVVLSSQWEMEEISVAQAPWI